MAISLTTDWAKKRYIMLLIFYISALLASTIATGLSTSGKQKRQLFREHLLPQQGGKIPETAFDPNRLVINKFSQNGLYSPDGYHLEHRHPDYHHHPKQYLPNTLKVPHFQDDRYVAPAGRFSKPQTGDTTYLIREPAIYLIFPRLRTYTPTPLLPQTSLKIIRQFKYQKVNNYEDGSRNDVNESPDMIFTSFAPYLRKLHETD